MYVARAVCAKFSVLRCIFMAAQQPKRILDMYFYGCAAAEGILVMYFYETVRE